jgi:hypothetical protein
MGYNTQNHWIVGLCPSSGILETSKHNVAELDLFPSSGNGGLEGLEDAYSVGSLRKG